MKPVKRFKTVIEKIAAQHGLDLTATQSHLRLENEGYMPLVIEKVGKDRVSVAHYYEQNGDLIADPDVVCWIAPGGDWFPIEMQQPPIGRFSGYSAVVVDWKDGRPNHYYPRMQSGIASFCATWAKNLVDQGFTQIAAKQETAK